MQEKFRHLHASALLLTVLAVIVLEIVGAFSPKFVTITRFVVAHTPWWVRAAFCLWLFWHWVLER